MSDNLLIEYKNSKTYMDWQCDKGHNWRVVWSSLKNLHTWCPRAPVLAQKNSVVKL